MNSRLTRRTPLRAKTPLERGTRLLRSSGLSRSHRDTGPKRKVADAVRDRFEGKCARCGKPGHSKQHRDPRGMGGTSDPAINRLSNLVWLCGDGNTRCHGEVESYRIQARKDGYLVPDGVRPADHPMRLWDGRVVLLTDDGGIVELIESERAS